jgi:hypothetical protein
MSLETNIKSALTDLATDWKTIKTWLFGSTAGSLADLNTTDKTSLVGAINELEAVSGAVDSASESTAGIVELATLAEVATGTDTSRAVTAAGVRQERDAVKAEILGGAGPAFDTLNELKALVDAAEESADITSLTTLVGTKANSADVYTKAEIGNPEADLAAYYQAAKA